MLFQEIQRLRIILHGHGKKSPSEIKCSKISPKVEKRMMLSDMICSFSKTNSDSFIQETLPEIMITS